MASPPSQNLYSRRKELIEPTFGIIKEQQAGRRLLLRGLANVDSEWVLLAVAFNLRVLAQIWRKGLVPLITCFYFWLQLVIARTPRPRFAT